MVVEAHNTQYVGIHIDQVQYIELTKKFIGVYHIRIPFDKQHL